MPDTYRIDICVSCKANVSCAGDICPYCDKGLGVKTIKVVPKRHAKAAERRVEELEAVLKKLRPMETTGFLSRDGAAKAIIDAALGIEETS